jgi:hypothetical protein
MSSKDSTVKLCNCCNVERELTEYYRSKTLPGGLEHKCKVCKSDYQKANLPSCTAARKKAAKKWRDNNSDKVKVKKLEWSKANSSRVNCNNAKRRAAKLLRTPAWLTPEDHEKIQDFYLMAKYMEITTGIKHHVDHIIPLQGKNVSGLHVPSNLQILTENENKTKSNKYLI